MELAVQEERAAWAEEVELVAWEVPQEEIRVVVVQEQGRGLL